MWLKCCPECSAWGVDKSIMGNPPALPGRQQKFGRSGSPRGKLQVMSRQAYGVVDILWTGKDGRMCLFPCFAVFGRGHGPLLRRGYSCHWKIIFLPHVYETNGSNGFLTAIIIQRRTIR